MCLEVCFPEKESHGSVPQELDTIAHFALSQQMRKGRGPWLCPHWVPFECQMSCFFAAGWNLASCTRELNGCLGDRVRRGKAREVCPAFISSSWPFFPNPKLRRKQCLGPCYKCCVWESALVFFCCCHEIPPTKGNLKEKWLTLPHNCRIQSVTAGNLQQWELESSSHAMPGVKNKERCVCMLTCLCSTQHPHSAFLNPLPREWCHPHWPGFSHVS